MTGPSPRTLADELRSRSDAELAGLLRARPDLLSPLPGDLSQLATRAGTRASVLRALDRLDTFALQTAEALAVAGSPCPLPALAALLPGGEERLPAAVDTLRARALLWGGPEALRLVRTARELLAPAAARRRGPDGAGPAVAPGATGLGPALADAAAGISPSRIQELLAHAGLPPTGDPVSALAALAGLFSDPTRMNALLSGAPEGARAALDRLTWGPPYGEIGAAPGAHLRWLLDRGLLVRTAPGTVVLPREAALHLRGGRAHRELRPYPPEVCGRAVDPAAAGAAAAGAALTATTVVEELLADWGRERPPVLRAGGLAVRDLKRLAHTLDVAEPEAAFWLELAYAAGLLAADGEADERYAPTPAADDWLARPVQDRWAALAAAWLATTRVPGLVGTRDAKGRVLAALGPGLDRGPAAELRLEVLRIVAGAAPRPPAPGPWTDEPAATGFAGWAGAEGGDAVTAADPEGVRARLAWELPRRLAPEARDALCRAVLHEAELLGVTGRGAPASFARALLEPALAGEGPGDPAAAAAALAPLLPAPVDHVLLQADLTAVAPGPLTRDLRASMALAADVESTGGATVYRFTPASVRRALDAGRTPEELHAFLASASRTPVPQPLSYLVDDVARRHGTLRVGAAAGYLRCEDEALLSQLFADRRAAGLRLRRLAPTVAVSDVPPEILLERLRGLGLAPAAESAEGAVVTLPPAAGRTPPRSAPAPAPDGPPPAEPGLLAAAVRAIRAGDHAAAGAERARAARVPEPSGPPPRTPAAETLAALRQAAAAGTPVRIGYVGSDGVADQRVLTPVRVEGGLVTAFDHTADEVRTYPLHRITGSAPAVP